MTGTDGMNLGEYWPEFANYSPTRRPWRDILSNPSRLVRPSSSKTDLSSNRRLEIMDQNFPELFFESVIKYLARAGYHHIFRLARCCKRSVSKPVLHVDTRSHGFLRFQRFGRDPCVWQELCLNAWSFAGIEHNRRELRRCAIKRRRQTTAWRMSGCIIHRVVLCAAGMVRGEACSLAVPGSASTASIVGYPHHDPPTPRPLPHFPPHLLPFPTPVPFLLLLLPFLLSPLLSSSRTP